MVGRRGIHGAPRDYVADGAWPHGRVEGPPEARVAAGLAERLADAVGSRSLRDVARVVGIDHTTLSALLAGKRWPDLVTIARLEHALGADLWPGRHPNARR